MTGFKRLLPAGLLALGLMTAAVPVHADVAELTGFKLFVDRTYSQYGTPDPNDWEDVLYVAAKAKPTEGEAVAEFGRRIGVDATTARRYADVIIEAVAFRNAADNYRGPPKIVPFAPGQKLYDLTSAVAMKEPAGQLLFVVGKVVNREPEAFIRLAKSHPAAASLFCRLIAYGTKGPYLIAALQALPADPSGVTPPVLWPQQGYHTPYSESLTLGAVDAVHGRMNRTPETRPWRAALSRYMIGTLLETGNDSEAVALYRAGVDELLPLWLEARSGKEGESAAATAREEFTRNVAAALWRQGDATAALGLIDRLGAKDVETELVRDALSPAIADAALFDLYIRGRPCGENKTDCKRGIRNGNLGFAGGATPAVKALLGSRLDRAGYADMARDIAVPLRPYFQPVVRGYDSIGDLLPEGAEAKAAVWKARLDAWVAQAGAGAEPKGTVTVTVTQLPVLWNEKPLPAGIAPWSDKDKPANIAEQAGLSVPARAILRHEGLTAQDQGKDGAVLFTSARYDLPGEIPAYGLWLKLRHDNAWGPDLYLGLQQHFPYVATRGSRLPLINRDNPADPRLQIEVRVAEIDPGTITFPPVGLNLARQASGLYLDIPLADVTRDSDGDGLSDIEEARLGLKPGQKDSDGDGVDDGFDPLPLTAYKPAADDARALVARTVLEKVMHHDKGAIMIAPRKASDDKPGLKDDLAAVLGGGGISRRAEGTWFLVGDPEMFAGVVNVPGQFIVYSPADLKALKRDKGVFYPPELKSLYRSLDGKRWYVDWSAGWVGGSFMIDCSGTTCKTEDLGGWIT